jgi:menaquinone-dependent protoporphyrinogen IX oxidase
MKGVIIYKGKYGATRQYAQWLSNELKFPAVQPEELNSGDITSCDPVILGSAVYMGKLLIKNWMIRNLGVLKNRKLFLFIVCATSPTEKEKLDVIVKNNVPLSIKDQTTIHFLHGKMDIKGLTWTDRFFLKMGARLEKDPKTKKEMLTDFDAVKRENLTALINDVKAFNSGVSIAV